MPRRKKYIVSILIRGTAGCCIVFLKYLPFSDHRDSPVDDRARKSEGFLKPLHEYPVVVDLRFEKAAFASSALQN